MSKQIKSVFFLERIKNILNYWNIYLYEEFFCDKQNIQLIHDINKALMLASKCFNIP